MAGEPRWEPVIPSAQGTWEVDGVVFSSAFDGGNLAGVSAASDGAGRRVFDLRVAGDCEGTPFSCDYRVYYFFSVSCAEVGRAMTLRLVNLSPIVKVYLQDVRPLVRVPSVSARWERVPASRCSVELNAGGSVRLTFRHVVGSEAPAWFALYYPFAYADCQRLLHNIDSVLGTFPSSERDGDGSTARARPTGGARERGGGNSGGSPDSADDVAGGVISSVGAEVYYHRELMVRSPEGRRVDLLTVSSRAGMLDQRESAAESLSPGLFPDRGPRPFRFRDKPIVWVSARVHPGETAASYAVHGLLALLLQPRNAWARALRSRFVFKIVPMLNPDGVARGHFRTDVFGVNLNRAFGTPRLDRQPSIYASRVVMKDCCSRSTPLWCCLDLHGFTARQGCYLLGNSLTPAREARALVFAALVQSYAPQFNASSCPFGRRKSSVAKPLPSSSSSTTPITPTTTSSLSSGGGEEDGGGGEDAYPSPLLYSTHPVGIALGEAEAAALASVRFADPQAAPGDLFGGAAAAPGAADAETRLHESDHQRAVREWAGTKAGGAVGGGGEAVKEGTARAFVGKELACAHAYTVECSCNLIPHARVFGRIYAGQVASPPAASDEDRTTLLCANASLPVLSQILDESPPESSGPRHLVPDPLLSSRHRKRPYACQVDSLQPPRDSPHYAPPLGFPKSIPRAGAGAFHCPWGTCPLDPPSCFAAVGRALLMALLDLAGGDGAVESRVRDSPWRSAAELNAWARKVCRVPPSIPPVLEAVADVSTLRIDVPNSFARSRSEPPAHLAASHRAAHPTRSLFAASGARVLLSPATPATDAAGAPRSSNPATTLRSTSRSRSRGTAGLSSIASSLHAPLPRLQPLPVAAAPLLLHSEMPGPVSSPSSPPLVPPLAPPSPPSVPLSTAPFLGSRRRAGGLLLSYTSLPPLASAPPSATPSRAASPSERLASPAAPTISSKQRPFSKSDSDDNDGPRDDASPEQSDPAVRLLRDLARLQAARGPRK